MDDPTDRVSAYREDLGRFLDQLRDLSPSEVAALDPGSSYLEPVARTELSDDARTALAYLQREAIARAQAEGRADHDPLTGALNRRGLEASVDGLERHARRNHERIYALMVDGDNFKIVNDLFGHEAGDEALKHVVSSLEAHVRAEDLVARWGGEEFLVLYAVPDNADPYEIADRTRTYMKAGSGIEINGKPWSISSGLTEHLPGTPVEETIALADAALYQAKARGKDRVVGILDTSEGPVLYAPGPDGRLIVERYAAGTR